MSAAAVEIILALSYAVRKLTAVLTSFGCEFHYNYRLGNYWVFIYQMTGDIKPIGPSAKRWFVIGALNAFKLPYLHAMLKNNQKISTDKVI